MTTLEKSQCLLGVVGLIGERLLSEAMMRNIANREIYDFTKVLFEIG